jgi:hypothetical protein
MNDDPKQSSPVSQKRIAEISTLVLIIAACTIAGIFIGLSLAQYRATTKLEKEMSSLSMAVGTLAIQPRELQVGHFTGFISTSDRSGIAPDWFARGRFPAENHLKVGASKPWPHSHVYPEVRLPFGAATNFEYTIDIQQFGRVVDVWLSRTSPKAAFDSFEEFEIKWQSTNSATLTGRLKPNASVGMQFEIVILSVAPVLPPGH